MDNLMETMTKGRVYVLIDKNKNTPKSIVYFDTKNKRNKQKYLVLFLLVVQFLLLVDQYQ